MKNKIVKSPFSRKNGSLSLTNRIGIMDKKKVVVNFCEAGQGHIVTAQSIAESLESKYGDKIDVVRDYMYRDSGDKTLINHEKYLIKDVCRANKNRLHLVFQLLLMKVFGEKFTINLVYNLYFGKVKKKSIVHLASMKADMYVSTHFESYYFACCAKAKGLINSLVVNYNPDHNVHGWWDRRGDIFIVNNPFAEKEALEKHFPKERVKRVNFMARKQIVNANESKEFYREKLGIPQGKFTVMLSDGGYAAAKLEEYTDELLKTDAEITLIPVCGKNEKLYEKYLSLKNVKQNITFMPVPFLTNIEEYYAASDILITKAGPNAITDCVFMGTPIMTNFYSGKIEQTSSRLFTEYYKTGVFEPDAKEARKKIEAYAADPSLLDVYRENTKKLDKTKNGADEIADIIAEALGVI